MKRNTWLVVANASIARLFKIEDAERLIPFDTLKHDESRLHNLDLVSDKPGRQFESVGITRHSVGSGTTPKQHEEEVFAKEVASYLEKAYANGNVHHLYIAAGPKFLGLLRDQLHLSTKKIIFGEINKELVHLTVEEILEHLPEVHLTSLLDG